MQLDVRAPMGAMFALLGGALTVYGLVSDPSIYKSSLGINVNLWWGLFILGLGLVMLLLAWWSWRSVRTSAAPEPKNPETPRP